MLILFDLVVAPLSSFSYQPRRILARLIRVRAFALCLLQVDRKVLFLIILKPSCFYFSFIRVYIYRALVTLMFFSYIQIYLEINQIIIEFDQFLLALYIFVKFDQLVSLT